MKYKKTIIGVIFVSLCVVSIFLYQTSLKSVSAEGSAKFWNFQSIDTMKYSRDTAREKLNDPTFDIIIERQISDIADTGATHVGIATPYDDEFLPILNRWVKMARKYHMRVWFRGNFSGWEQWFGYEKIDRATHLQKTREFILENPQLFEDGDIFSACPECENGGPGDPRMNGDAAGHKKFLIDEHKASQKAFKQIRKNVETNFNSMNGDVARLIMDKETTKALGGLVVVDHYVSTPEQLNDDITKYAEQSGGKVVLGEFGVPIPDINGEMSEIEQAEWLSQALPLLAKNEHLVGLNYWVNVGGSTELWDSTGKDRAGVISLKKAYSPFIVQATVKNVKGTKIRNATISGPERTMKTDKNGIFVLPIYGENAEISVSAPGYRAETIKASNLGDQVIILEKENPSMIDKILRRASKLTTFSTPLHNL